MEQSQSHITSRYRVGEGCALLPVRRGRGFYRSVLYEKEAEIGRQKKKLDELTRRDQRNGVLILQIQLDGFLAEFEICSLKQKLAGLEEASLSKSERSDLESTYQALAQKWHKETAHVSSTTELIMNPSYQNIIGLGPRVVPILLRQLQQKPEHWFWALSAITRENPVSSEDEGNVRKMAEAWLQWGVQRRLV